MVCVPWFFFLLDEGDSLRRLSCCVFVAFGPCSAFPTLPASRRAASRRFPFPPLLDPLCLFVCHFEQLGRPPRFLSVYLTDIAAGSVS